MQPPKLRTDIDVMPVQVDGKNMYAVTDTLGLIKNPVGITRELLDLMVLLDGRRNIADIHTELTRIRKGEPVSRDEVTSVIRELESAMILENFSYHNAKSALIRDFTESRSREASLSGKAYPEERASLHNYLGEIIGAGEKKLELLDKKIAAIVAPHIDLEVGKEGYCEAYRQLAGLSPEIVIILGTGHKIATALFSLTKKDFETPIGLLKTDRSAVEALLTAGDGVITENDFDHKSEHSIEFQTLFLKYMLRERSFGIVPILCGDVTQYAGRYASFSEVPGVDRFCDALRKLAAGRKCLIVAGVDLSHIGPKFGDRHTAEVLKEETEEHDKALMRAVVGNNREEYWSLLRESGDKYHVCGASSLAVLLEILPDVSGDTLYYEMWQEKATLSAVSFCSIAFREA